MPDPDPNIQIVQQVPKTWKDRGIDWFFNQGTTVMVLMIGVGVLGWYVAKQLPERDASWAKAMNEQASVFAKALEERDKRFIEYRSLADTKYAATVTSLIERSDKDYDRLERALRGSIDDIRRHSEATAKKVETLVP